MAGLSFTLRLDRQIKPDFSCTPTRRVMIGKQRVGDKGVKKKSDGKKLSAKSD